MVFLCMIKAEDMPMHGMVSASLLVMPIILPIKKSRARFASFSDALLKFNVISSDKLTVFAEQAHQDKLPLERYLVQKNLVDPAAFTLAAAAYLNMPPLTLPENYSVQKELISSKPIDFWMKAKAVPVMKLCGRLTIAFADPFDLPSQEEVSRAAGGRIWSCVAPEKDVMDALGRLKVQEDAANPALAMENIMKGQDTEIEFSSAEEKEDAIDASAESAGEAPVIRMVNTMMIEALKTKASDIHFEAGEKTSRLRYRIDGELVERPAPPKALHSAVVSRIKIMSKARRS